jgi:hypothetical protein
MSKESAKQKNRQAVQMDDLAICVTPLGFKPGTF